MTSRRIAFFTDSFHEVNGVALTSREYVNFARRREIPVLSVHAGPQNRVFREGSIVTVEFRRGPVRWNLEHDLAFDYLALRHRGAVWAALREFKPDLIHITGPGDAGILGALAAWEFGIPLAASWHTNVHEYASRRLNPLIKFLPDAARQWAAAKTEAATLDLCVRFYRLAKILYAPNPELVKMLAARTGRPTFLMGRGSDTVLFNPVRRVRTDGAFVIGYVGRLSAEKNVRMLASLEKKLLHSGLTDCRFLVVGEGSERSWLSGALRNASVPGVLRGEELARAYASMDVFVFPSSTDTFGNVVLEAMASGVPPIVAAGGGPRFVFDDGVEGFVANDEDGFAEAILTLYHYRSKLDRMRVAARTAAGKRSWDAVFEQVHSAYGGVNADPARVAAISPRFV